MCLFVNDMLFLTVREIAFTSFMLSIRKKVNDYDGFFVFTYLSIYRNKPNQINLSSTIHINYNNDHLHYLTFKDFFNKNKL